MRDCRTAIAGLADLAARQPFFIVDRWKVKVESRLTSRGFISKNGWARSQGFTLGYFHIAPPGQKALPFIRDSRRVD
jgi:hypothetical protein